MYIKYDIGASTDCFSANDNDDNENVHSIAKLTCLNVGRTWIMYATNTK